MNPDFVGTRVPESVSLYTPCSDIRVDFNWSPRLCPATIHDFDVGSARLIIITYVIHAAMTGVYHAPDVSIERITGVFVRDELLKCFESANKEFLILLHQPVADEALKAQVKQFVEGVFQSCGVSYTDPTKTGILTAMTQCKTNAERMMGPQGAEIIRHHYAEMMKLVERLPTEETRASPDMIRL